MLHKHFLRSSSKAYLRVPRLDGESFHSDITRALPGVSKQRPRSVVDIADLGSGHGDVHGVPWAERVDATFPRLALDGRRTTHLAERGRELLERPEKLDEGTWA